MLYRWVRSRNRSRDGHLSYRKEIILLSTLLYGPFRTTSRWWYLQRLIVTWHHSRSLLQNIVLLYCWLRIRMANIVYALIIGYWMLNSLTVRQYYSLPRIDDQIDRPHNGIYCTCLDLCSGYYQVTLGELSKKYIQFVRKVTRLIFCSVLQMRDHVINKGSS